MISGLPDRHSILPFFEKVPSSAHLVLWRRPDELAFGIPSLLNIAVIVAFRCLPCGRLRAGPSFPFHTSSSKK